MLRLYEKWLEDDKNKREAAIYNAIFATMYGSIYGSAYKKEEMQSLGGWNLHFHAFLSLLEQKEVFSKPDDNIIPLPCGIRQNEAIIDEYALQQIVPLVFFIKPFDFKELTTKVQQYTERCSSRTVLECILYISILSRLRCCDDLPRAVEIAEELCTENLAKGIYTHGFNWFPYIFERDIKTLSTADIRAKQSDLSLLERAVAVCLQSNSFHDVIENAAQLDHDPIRASLIASTAGSLYGMEHSNTLYDELRAYSDKKRKKDEPQRDDEQIEAETRKLCDFLLKKLHTKNSNN